MTPYIVWTQQLPVGCYGGSCPELNGPESPCQTRLLSTCSVQAPAALACKRMPAARCMRHAPHRVPFKKTGNCSRNAQRPYHNHMRKQQHVGPLGSAAGSTCSNSSSSDCMCASAGRRFSSTVGPISSLGSCSR